jgi:GT2 family glycosyltransferase
MKISIVTSYYNRKEQFLTTLKTIKLSKQIDNLEIIVVDDGSSDVQRLDDIIIDYPFVKLIRIEPQDKWYANPCIPFNKAINSATGDIIVLQNPECLHVGDILTNIVDNLTNDNYITYSVYSADYNATSEIKEYYFNEHDVFGYIKDRLTPFNTQNYVSEGRSCWYNHSLHRPCAYHFISAITKENMNKLNGFDERFASGIGFDDDEFLYRVRKLGLNVEIIDSPFGVHQWHYSENNFFARVKNPVEASHRNSNIFNNITKNLESCRVNLTENDNLIK